VLFLPSCSFLDAVVQASCWLDFAVFHRFILMLDLGCPLMLCCVIRFSLFTVIRGTRHHAALAAGEVSLMVFDTF
jgi:hypothetical protein